MQFTINDQVVSANDVEATETILSFLRRSGFTGTKEGCASGDCGACTVMVADTSNSELEYHTINACIAPISQYANYHIVTVEGLEQKDGTLHPAQQAMVDCHGSQCGFCTPGFVMSLAALTQANEDLTEDKKQAAVRDAISGNLCRCTGYKPIIKAGVQALGTRVSIYEPAKATETTELPNNFYQPSSLSELNDALKSAPEARLIGGGTDLMLEVTQLYRELPGLIDLTLVPQLQELTEEDGLVTLGGAVPYTTLEDFFNKRSPQLVRLLHRLGSRQIRNSGTIGGNIGNGSPIADIPPVLLTLDANLQIGRSDGSTRKAAINEFYLGYRDIALEPGEYIISVSFPSEALNSFHRFYKNSKRIEDDISSVMGAFLFECEGETLTSARVAYGGMAATPIRLEAVELLLENNSPNPDTITKACDLAAQQLKPMTDVRASADYRKAMAVQMLERSLRELNGEEILDITEVPVR